MNISICTGSSRTVRSSDIFCDSVIVCGCFWSMAQCDLSLKDPAEQLQFGAVPFV